MPTIKEDADDRAKRIEAIKAMARGICRSYHRISPTNGCWCTGHIKHCIALATYGNDAMNALLGLEREGFMALKLPEMPDFSDVHIPEADEEEKKNLIEFVNDMG